MFFWHFFKKMYPKIAGFCFCSFLSFARRDWRAIRKSQQEEHCENNEHLVFKTFTSNSKHRTDIPLNHVKTCKTRQFENPRGYVEHHETTIGNIRLHLFCNNFGNVSNIPLVSLFHGFLWNSMNCQGIAAQFSTKFEGLRSHFRKDSEVWTINSKTKRTFEKKRKVVEFWTRH